MNQIKPDHFVQMVDYLASVDLKTKRQLLVEGRDNRNRNAQTTEIIWVDVFDRENGS